MSFAVSKDDGWFIKGLDFFIINIIIIIAFFFTPLSRFTLIVRIIQDLSFSCICVPSLVLALYLQIHPCILSLFLFAADRIFPFIHACLHFCH